MLHFIEGFAFSVFITMIILVTNKYHSKFSHDNDLNAIQKYHTIPAPRIGGMVIFFSLFLILIIDEILNNNVMYYKSILHSVMLVFVIGILEDITQKITPILRLSIFIISSFCAIYIFRALPIIHYIGFNYLNSLTGHFIVIGIFLSLFCVVGLTNAYNIIDGYNGLSSTTALLNFLGLIIIANYVGDVQVINICLVLCGAIIGFWLFNYPWGKIFLGDGGAYTLGFIIAIISIHLAHTYKGIISPYAVLLMSIYPITEIGFSLFRRKFIHKTRGMQPDNMHMHQLIYHRCVPLFIKNRNAMVMPLMLIFMIPQTILAVIFYKNVLITLLLSIIYVVYYVIVYFKIIRFQTPWFLKIIL